MPTVKTVSVKYGRKVNLGDFNSTEIECTLWADVEEGEDLDQAMRGLWTMATENVKGKMQSVKPGSNGSANVKELFLGLPVKES